MPVEDPHLQFQQWANEYGPIYSLMLGTKTMIVLSNDQAVRDLLDKKSVNFSSRPDLYTGHQLLSGNKRMVMMPYGSPWRKVKIATLQVLHYDSNASSDQEVVSSCITREQVSRVHSIPRLREQATFVRIDDRPSRSIGTPEEIFYFPHYRYCVRVSMRFSR